MKKKYVSLSWINYRIDPIYMYIFCCKTLIAYIYIYFVIGMLTIITITKIYLIPMFNRLYINWKRNLKTNVLNCTCIPVTNYTSKIQVKSKINSTFLMHTRTHYAHVYIFTICQWSIRISSSQTCIKCQQCKLHEINEYNK